MTSQNRVTSLDWTAIARDLDTRGWAILPRLLTIAECGGIATSYDSSQRFRSHVKMARHGFGRGEYKYFSYPLPDLVDELRTLLYPPLADIANIWYQRMALEVQFPAAHAEFLKRCHTAGQTQPTPLLLQYAEGDFNCLHQDLYGEHVFPLQVAVLLSDPTSDFAGGEFVLTEQRPRMQSRVEVVPLTQGDGVIFAVNQRPVLGGRGVYRVKLRHGVSTYDAATVTHWVSSFTTRSSAAVHSGARSRSRRARLRSTPQR